MNINILKKWNEQYLRLSSFNRKARRTLKKRWKKSLLVIALALALGVSDASAATITVGETELGIGAVTIEDDGICSITEALQNANDTSGTAPNNDCETGDSADGINGADIIELPSNSTFTFDGINPSTFTGDGQNALPLITSNITIEGNASVLERMEDPLPPGAPIPDFRIINTNGNLTLNNLTLRNGRENFGGAVINDISNDVITLTLNNCTVSGNTSLSDGGGINSYRGNLTINNSNISQNSAFGDGGGIYNNRSNLSINNSFITENSALSNGGGIYHDGNSNTTFDLINSNVSYNLSQQNGGGIYSREDFTVTNSTISNNMAGFNGGGLFSIFNSLSITNTTISQNTATYGGGIRIDSTFNITNSIIANNISTNTSNILANCDLFFSVIVEENNLSDDDSCSFDSDTSSESFISDCLEPPLADNGGPTLTHALLDPNDPNTPSTCTQNPAIDGGDNAACPSTDQRGFIRPFPVGGACDIGAFELQPTGSGMCNMAEIPEDGVDNNGDGQSL